MIFLFRFVFIQYLLAAEVDVECKGKRALDLYILSEVHGTRWHDEYGDTDLHKVDLHNL